MQLVQAASSNSTLLWMLRRSVGSVASQDHSFRCPTWNALKINVEHLEKSTRMARTSVRSCGTMLSYMSHMRGLPTRSFGTLCRRGPTQTTLSTLILSSHPIVRGTKQKRYDMMKCADRQRFWSEAEAQMRVHDSRNENRSYLV